ncbi:UNVERIFIED_CONTAM: hypothetical protein HDU68_012027, partial [Siphonaria sp. JEL0065]
MSKRVADNYLTSLNAGHPMDNDEPEPTGEFKRASEDKLKQRVIAAPRRRTAAASSGTPAASLTPSGGAFSGFSFGAPAASTSTSTPIQKPVNTFNAGATPFAFASTKPQGDVAASVIPPPIPSFGVSTSASVAQPAASTAKPTTTTTTTTTPSKNTIALAQSLRALNASFLAFVRESVENDPFVDLTSVADKYRAFYSQVLEKEKGAVDVLRERVVNTSNTTTAASSTTATSGGFSFGSASTSTTTASSSSASGFSFKPASTTSSTSNPTATSVGTNWECDTCLASNPSEKAKCVCCEAAKPGNPKSSSTTPAPVTGVSFGGVSSTTAAPPSTGAFTFGKASSSAPAAATTGGFTFGASASPAAIPKPAAVAASGPNWECDTCLVSNPSDKVKCLSCEATKPGNAKASSTTPAPVSGGFSFSGASTSPPTASSGGFTFGGASTSTPSASSTTGSFSFGGDSSTAPKPAAVASSGPNWDCDTCLVSNPPDKVKCMACEAAKPGNAKSSSTTPAPVSRGFSFGGGSSTSIASSGGFTFGGAPTSTPAPTTGEFSFGKSATATSPAHATISKPPVASGPNWECDTCLVSNPSDKVKCMSCEAAKPGNAKASSTTPGGGFSFGKASIPTSASTATATSGFSLKPATTEEKSKSPVKASGGFSFGGSTTAPSGPTSGGFSFGAAPSTTAPASTGGFSFGFAAPASTTSTFSGFGSLAAPAAPAAPTTTTTAASNFGGLGGLSSNPSTATAETTGGDEDDEPAPDEQIDQETLMRGAGEESEQTLYSVLTRTHVYDATNKKWADVGKGILKINQNPETKKSRLILRADGSGRVLLNVAVFSGMVVKLET